MLRISRILRLLWISADFPGPLRISWFSRILKILMIVMVSGDSEGFDDFRI